MSIKGLETVEAIDSNDYFEYTKRTFKHDIKYVQEVFDVIVVANNRINVCGDKAFRTSDKFNLNDKELNIVTAKKKKSSKQRYKQIKKTEIELINLYKKIQKLKSTNCIRYEQYMKNEKKLLKKLNDLSIEKKNKYSRKEKRLLSGRYIVENYFLDIKKYERIVLRKDKSICTFINFIYMANIIEMCKKYGSIYDIRNDLLK